MNKPILRDFTKVTYKPGENNEDRINRVHEDLFDIRLRIALQLKECENMDPDERADLEEIGEKALQAWKIIDTLFYHYHGKVMNTMNEKEKKK